MLILLKLDLKWSFSFQERSPANSEGNLEPILKKELSNAPCKNSRLVLSF